MARIARPPSGAWSSSISTQDVSPFRTPDAPAATTHQPGGLSRISSATAVIRRQPPHSLHPFERRGRRSHHSRSGRGQQQPPLLRLPRQRWRLLQDQQPGQSRGGKEPWRESGVPPAHPSDAGGAGVAAHRGAHSQPSARDGAQSPAATTAACVNQPHPQVRSHGGEAAGHAEVQHGEVCWSGIGHPGHLQEGERASLCSQHWTEALCQVCPWALTRNRQ